ncbi:hypothetical protein N7530_010879 [Penicillium desertorum]|uniref:Uncharacterized protein n=1 Tax=Penicillium desertorum TaxID=1303715 RepID=A0A9W9WG36_9EURO|nr:hypothetical protein N7530_010879 [Penicillium desertorum]
MLTVAKRRKRTFKNSPLIIKIFTTIYKRYVIVHKRTIIIYILSTDSDYIPLRSLPVIDNATRLIKRIILKTKSDTFYKLTTFYKRIKLLISRYPSI